MQKLTNSLMAGLFGRRSPPTGQDGLFYIYLLLMFQWLPYTVAQSNRVTLTAFYADFSISGIIALILVFGACFFLFFITIWLYRYSRTETSRTLGLNDVQGRISRTVTQGLEPAFIETLPVFPYSHVKDHKLGNGALECAVCLKEFEDEDKLRLLPKCDHVFHPECIDVWLANHVTCPVCRASLLVPSTNDNPAAIVPVHDIESNSDPENPTLEPVDQENKQVSPAPEVITQTQMQNRAGRLTKLRCEGRYPRSHSTGHSLVQPGENLERFTLRLPKDMRDQIMNTSHLNRTRSMMALPMQMSSRKGYLMTDEGSSEGGKSTVEKPEGSVFSMTPPFFMRAFSRRSQKIAAVGGDAPVTSPRRKVLMSPLGVYRKADETVPSIASSPV